jgi:hypothetical protein
MRLSFQFGTFADFFNSHSRVYVLVNSGQQPLSRKSGRRINVGRATVAGEHRALLAGPSAKSVEERDALL